MSEVEERHWQSNLDAEQSVLGALLIDNAALDSVADVVTEADFYTGDHRAIFQMVATLINSGKAADVITVADGLVQQDAEKFRGILSYLGGLAQAGTPFNARRYAEIVKDRSVRRELFRAGARICESVQATPSHELGELKELSQTLVMSAALGESERSAFVQLQPMLSKVMAEIDDRFTARQAGTLTDLIGVPTGFRDLDDLTLGMQGGQLIIVGARPGMGKSAFALNVAENAARAAGSPAIFFSLEMSDRQLAFRMLAQRAGVNVQRLYTGRLYDGDWERISSAMGQLAKLPVVFCERGDVGMADIRSLARRARREYGGLSLIVVDYLQLMLGADSDANRAAQLSEITRGLKVMAKELNVPVMALSQLNRQLEARPNKRPMSADLRDSGSIEQDADNIFFIYRDEVYNPRSDDRGVAEIIIAKQRDGPTGTIRLNFRADHTRFSNYTVDAGQVSV